MAIINVSVGHESSSHVARTIDAEPDAERRERRAELLKKVYAPAHSWLHTASLQTVQEMIDRKRSASAEAMVDE